MLLKYRILMAGLVIIIGISIYYDLTNGTLPKNTSFSAKENTQKEETLIDEQAHPFQEVIVDHGYTVLSIVEHLHEGTVPVSIQQIINDFEHLNPGVEADKIKVGKPYLFPIYLTKQ